MRIPLFIFSLFIHLLTVNANELFIRNAKEAGEIGDFLSENYFDNMENREGKEGKLEISCGLYGKDTEETHIVICGADRKMQDDIILLLQMEIQKREWKPICVVF